MRENMSVLKKIKLQVIRLVVIFALIIIFYLIFFSFNPFLFIILVFGSVAIISTSTLYTVIHHIHNQDEREKESRLFSKPKEFKSLKRTKIKKIPLEESLTKIKSENDTKAKKEDIPQIIEEYIKALPYLGEYLESDKNYDNFAIIQDLVFSLFSYDELKKINLLNLSNVEKLQFIREMIYYTRDERRELLENMLKYRNKGMDDEIEYVPPRKTFEMGEYLRVYLISLLEKGEKRRLLIISTDEKIKDIKKKAADLFNYKMDDFLITTGGLILDEDALVADYPIEEEDEIVLIPSRKENK